MNAINPELFQKVVDLSKQVNNNLSKKGIAIPVENEDGSISVGLYKIIKEQQFYSILNWSNEKVIENLNLPQTAILQANNLALGKFIDQMLIQNDKKYGFALFEEKRYSKQLKRRNLEKSTLFEIKLTDAKLKKNLYKKLIIDRFEKFAKMYK